MCDPRPHWDATATKNGVPGRTGDDAEGARGLSDQPPAGNPRAHPRQGPRISRARPERTRIAAGRHGIALVSAAAVPHSPANRDARLAQVPDDLRELVEDPAGAMGRAAAADAAGIFGQRPRAAYFSHVEPTNARRPGGSADRPCKQARWQALSEDERQKIAAQFNQFFELTPEEKQKTLNTLSDAERAQMEKTLQSFDKLPPAQRAQCIRAFTKFAGMSPAERAEFLKNAERWSQMPPKERQAWRDLVAQVPLWPPLPPALIMPPMPPPAAAAASATVRWWPRTNHELSWQNSISSNFRRRVFK